MRRPASRRRPVRVGSRHGHADPGPARPHHRQRRRACSPAGRRASRLDEHGPSRPRRCRDGSPAVPLAAVVTSPLERCRQTARTAAAAQARRRRSDTERAASPSATTATGPGRELKDLAKEPLWKTCRPTRRPRPSPAASRCARCRPARSPRSADWDARSTRPSTAPTRSGWRVSHGDVIKSVLADALGMHLDLFQRIIVDPALGLGHPLHRRSALRAGHQHRTRATCPGWPRGRRRARAPRRRRGRRATRLRRRRRRAATADPVGSSAWHRSSTASTRPSASSPARSARPASAPSSCRRAPAAGSTSVALEKQQVAVLAERIDELLDEVLRRSGGDAADPGGGAARARGHRARSSSRSRRSSAPAR